MALLVLLAGFLTDAMMSAPRDVPAGHEASWAMCRNEQGKVSLGDEMKGCEELIAATDVSEEIKAIAHSNRGMLLSQTLFRETAKQEFDRAIMLNPKLAPAYYNRALLLSASGEQKAAIRDYSSAISLLPTMVEAYINRGIELAESDEPEQALLDFDKAIELEPGSADLYENRAHLLRTLGRLQEAEADLATAKRLTK